MTTKMNRYVVTLMDRNFKVLAIIPFKAEDDAAAHNRGMEICWERKADEYRVEEAKA